MEEIEDMIDKIKNKMIKELRFRAITDGNAKLLLEYQEFIDVLQDIMKENSKNMKAGYTTEKNRQLLSILEQFRQILIDYKNS